ncbi:MerR family transcriptional regulator [Oceanirhabdus sp. W0125-5]|uniref:MerR family transcriptional regulator n=1 Tax=Oceanirhabdus sp. W0125-5 TaxID=2999116 RepID=UPI0022F342AB|nr:methyltransferase domain-containing protein [Oceanirhabdus sp. W0125-5]WBW97800.1 methyltransferase domain-containing protein [Oceanirhabdus sp. W0125-5]
MNKRYNIKEVAEIFKIPANKLRFYEKKGLLKPKRGENNYRYYSEDDFIRIQTILMYRTLNLSVEDISDLLANSEKANVLDHFYKQWEAVNNSIHRMRDVKNSLEKIMDSIYDGNNDGVMEGIIKSAQELNSIQETRENWKDKWNFDSWAKSYDKSVKNEVGTLNLYRKYDELLDTVYLKASEGLKQSDSILDIGVGTGNLSNRFLEKGYSVTGVDQSREMMNVAKNKYPNLKLRLGEFLKLPFDNGSFECIVSTYAFHHLNDEEKKLAIKEMMRVLTAEGTIVIGDMMFKDEESRREIFDRYTKEQIEEIEDEYYSDISVLREEFIKYGKTVDVQRIDELIYVVHVY